MFAPRHFGVRPLHALRECGVELAVLDQEGLEEVGASVEQASHAHVAGRLVGHLGLEGGAGGVKCAVGAQGAQLRAVEQRDCLLVVGGGDRVGRKDGPYIPPHTSTTSTTARCRLGLFRLVSLLAI